MLDSPCLMKVQAYAEVPLLRTFVHTHTAEIKCMNQSFSIKDTSRGPDLDQMEMRNEIRESIKEQLGVAGVKLICQDVDDYGYGFMVSRATCAIGR
jgi:hypothetical protein